MFKTDFLAHTVCLGIGWISRYVSVLLVHFALQVTREGMHGDVSLKDYSHADGMCVCSVANFKCWFQTIAFLQLMVLAEADWVLSGICLVLSVAEVGG